MKIRVTYTFDHEAWQESGLSFHYVSLSNRGMPPYRRQVRVEAILDIDEDGRLAGIEIIDDHAPPPRGV